MVQVRKLLLYGADVVVVWLRMLLLYGADVVVVWCGCCCSMVLLFYGAADCYALLPIINTFQSCGSGIRQGT